MKRLIIALATASALASSWSAAARPAASTHISKSALVAAGRQAKLSAIDYGENHCDGDLTVEEWLKSLVGRHARAIAWAAGDCQLVTDLNPGIDAASWPWCVRAEITLAHPRNRNDVPMAEIYLEKPAHGRPGAAYAFRGLMLTRDGGPDFIRFRREFEADWRERFPPDPATVACSDDDP